MLQRVPWRAALGESERTEIIPSNLDQLTFSLSIGRVTEGLLLDGIATQVDVIEPIAKFTVGLQDKSGVRTIFNMGLEDWQPSEGVQYDLIWVQWCVGHLTDEQLVQFLKRCKSTLNPEVGVIVVKENNSTGGEDVFDPLDSAVTRYRGFHVDIFPSRSRGTNRSLPGRMAACGAYSARQACAWYRSNCRKVSKLAAWLSCRSGCTHSSRHNNTPFPACVQIISGALTSCPHTRPFPS